MPKAAKDRINRKNDRILSHINPEVKNLTQNTEEPILPN